MLKDFREFAFKGNVVDLAVGVIIGASFGKIVTGVVDDLIMPLVGVMLPGGDWRAATVHVGAAQLKVGHLIGAALDFLIVAIVLFLVVSQIVQRMHKPAPTPETRVCPGCLESVAKEATRCKH
jgi:large conductance mechanosensitive channel